MDEPKEDKNRIVYIPCDIKTRYRLNQRANRESTPENKKTLIQLLKELSLKK